MHQSALITVLSFIVLLAIALLFLYLYLKTLQNEAVAYWKTVLENMRLRNDMVPNLIETIRKYTKNEEKLLAEMAALRSKSWPIELADGQKADAELSLTQDLHAIWELSQKIPALDRDTNFLSLKKELYDLGKEIDEMVDVYNKKIQSFNKRTGFILIRPLMALMRLKKFPIFEFEP